MPRLTADPFTHFAHDYIMAGRCGKRVPTLEELTEAWEDLDAEARSDYIVKAAEWAGDAAPGVGPPPRRAEDPDASPRPRRDATAGERPNAADDAGPRRERRRREE